MKINYNDINRTSDVNRNRKQKINLNDELAHVRSTEVNLYLCSYADL